MSTITTVKEPSQSATNFASNVFFNERIQHMKNTGLKQDWERIADQASEPPAKELYALDDLIVKPVVLNSPSEAGSEKELNDFLQELGGITAKNLREKALGR